MRKLIAVLSAMGAIMGGEYRLPEIKEDPLPHGMAEKMIAEYKLIKQKKSNLSANERARVIWWVEKNCKPEQYA